MADTYDLLSRVLYEMVGNEGIKVINCLDKPKTDLQINEETQLPVTRIRTTLNILHKYNMVKYVSSRDENKGWFKYTWKLNPESIMSSVNGYLGSKLMKLRRELQEITQVNYFKCENGCSREEFTVAYELNFRCQKCNGIFRPVDSANETKAIKNEIEQVRGMLEQIRPEMKAPIKDAG